MYFDYHGDLYEQMLGWSIFSHLPYNFMHISSILLKIDMIFASSQALNIFSSYKSYFNL